jgi:hypothetical protein
MVDLGVLVVVLEKAHGPLKRGARHEREAQPMVHQPIRHLDFPPAFARREPLDDELAAAEGGRFALAGRIGATVEPQEPLGIRDFFGPIRCSLTRT